MHQELLQSDQHPALLQTMCLFTLVVDGPQSVYVCLLEYVLHFIIN